MLKRVPIVMFLACFIGSLVLVSCGQPKENQNSEAENKKTSSKPRETKFVKPDVVAQGYVGSESCRRCHAEIMKEYESHPMSISMSETGKFEVEDYPAKTAVKAGNGSSWSAIRKDGIISHVEQVNSSTGTKLFEHSEVIDFTCGSSTNGCSYFAFDGGRMYQSPITWYTENREWDLSPGYEIPNHFRFERMAGDGCLACHAGRMNPDENHRGAYNQDKPFHELAIGCERCHGPGKEHIEFHDASSVGASVKDPIVNPDKLTPELREAVCYQCHLSGAPRVARYGRSDFDFRPGMHISDVWITFLKSGKNEGGKIKVVSQVEQMQLSQCFVQSKGEFGCISCHDPHRSPTPETRIGFYRDKCLTCHQNGTEQTECTETLDARKKNSPDDSCINCHMPTLDADDIAHLALTDHRVHVPGDNYQVNTKEVDGFRVWNDKKVPDHAVARARTIALAASAFTSRNRSMAESASRNFKSFDPPAKDDLPLLEAVAQLYLVAGNYKEALRIWNELLEQHPRDQFLLDQISMAYQNADQLEEALPIYDRLFQVNNRRPSVLMRHLEVCKKLSKFEEGIQVAQRILELEPGIKSVHQWLDRAYRRTGDPNKAEHHRKLAEQIPSR